jgi:hypothetical protein
LLFSGAFLVYESVWVAVAIAALLMLMPAIAMIDIEHRIIPNRVMYPSLVAFPVYLVVARLAGAPWTSSAWSPGSPRSEAPSSSSRSFHGGWGWAT